MRPESAGPVAGIVLAAGSSTRMGANKLLLRLKGETLLRRAAGSAVVAGLDPVIVVVGHEAEQASSELAGLAVEIVRNPEYALGINRSLKLGIAQVPGRACAAVVMLADMPMVTDRMVAALIDRFRQADAAIVTSDYAGVQAPPTLYARSVFAELGAFEGEGSGKSVIRKYASRTTTVSFPAAAAADIDRPEDLAKLDTEI